RPRGGDVAVAAIARSVPSRSNPFGLPQAPGVHLDLDQERWLQQRSNLDECGRWPDLVKQLAMNDEDVVGARGVRHVDPRPDDVPEFEPGLRERPPDDAEDRAGLADRVAGVHRAPVGTGI